MLGYGGLTGLLCGFAVCLLTIPQLARAAVVDPYPTVPTPLGFDWIGLGSGVAVLVVASAHRRRRLRLPRGDPGPHGDRGGGGAMTRSSRFSTAGLLTRHRGAGAPGSMLVAMLIAAAVLAVALAPRALGTPGTAELRHEFADESPALLDLTGIGQLGIRGRPAAGATLDDLVGASDASSAASATSCRGPLRDHSDRRSGW